MIDKNSIDMLRERVNIVDLISNYLELKKSGMATYKSNCPFHNEKTASFVVSESKQIFHCFGCSKGGNIYSFIMEYEKLAFPEAVERIADIYNYKLTYTKDERHTYSSDVLLIAQDMFVKTLKNSSENMNYLLSRGLSSETITKFGIGLIYDGSSVISELQKNRVELSEAVTLGLLGESGGRYYSRFSQRIMFPIYNYSSKLIAFGGRTINNHEAKYLNSPQSKVFDKSRTLYALNIAKEEIYKTKEMIVTEGYMDTISLHQAGYKNAVATLGTALTTKHMPIIKKCDAKVIIAYDGDNAGMQAAYKAVKLLMSHEIDGSVVLFTNGSDPADYVKDKKIDELKAAISKQTTLIDYYLNITLKKYDLNNPNHKSKAVKEISEFLQTLSPIYTQNYLPYCATALKVPTSYLKIKRNSREKESVSKNKNIRELSLIKSIINEPSLIDTVIEYIDSSYFSEYKEEFELLISGDLNSAKMRSIALDDSIKVLDREEIVSELMLLLKTVYMKNRYDIGRDKNISYNEKIFKIRKIDELILKIDSKGHV